MKKSLLSLILAILLILTSFTAIAEEDPRLAFHQGDDNIPTKDGQFFTRYTPWLKAYHPMTTAEIASGVHGGEACQQIRCINISPVDQSLAVFGTDTSGVWITTDGGNFWYNTQRNIHHTDIADVMCHPTNKNILFCYPIGTKTHEDTAPGIYRSEDMGRSWRRVYMDYINSSVTDKLFAYDSSGNIYAVTGHGIIKSTDTGKTWTVLKAATETNSETNRAPATSIKVSADGNIIVACYASETFSLGGINISTDGGTTWSKLAINGNTAFSAYAFEFDPQNANRYIASIYSPSLKRYGLFISSDKGKTWKEFAHSDSDYDSVLSDVRIGRIRITEDYLYVVYNQADRAFRYIPYEYLDKDVSSLWFPYIYKWKALDFENEVPADDKFQAPSNMFYSQGFDLCGDIMYVCAAGPHKYTFSTKTWERKSEGFSGNLIVDFNMDDSGNLMLSRADGNIVLSSSTYTEDSPATFNRPKGSYLTTVATRAIIDPNDAEGDRVIAWCGNSNTSKTSVGVIISEDSGKTWSGYDSATKTFTVLGADPKNCDAVLLEYDAENPTAIITSAATSPDNGTTWNMHDYYYLDICDSDPRRILAWDLYGINGASPTYKIMYSSDKGETWSALAKVGTSKSSEVTGFFDNSDTDIVWYKEQYGFGTINLTTGEKTSYNSRTGYGTFNNLVQNPRKPNHFILTVEALMEGYCPTLMESVDYGRSWHVVPGFFGCRTIANGGVKFSTTTDEVFLGSLSGIVVYEYENFNYYQAVRLKDDKNDYITTYEMFDGKVIAPHQMFEAPFGYYFEGWIYNGTTYAPGEEVTIK